MKETYIITYTDCVPSMEKGFDPGKNRISLFLVESLDCFSWVSRFFLPGVGRFVTSIIETHVFNLKTYLLRLVFTS